MRRLGIALVLAVSLSACVQTKQYADLQFTPPSGDYDLIVMRPDVSVGSLRTGGLVEPRADWTEQARGHLIEALKAQQGSRGGNVRILETRDGLDGVDPDTIAQLERLHNAVGNSIAIHKYLGATLPNKRKKGLDYTLGQQAVSFGEATGYDYALFMYAEDSIASTGRVLLNVAGVAGCFIGFCAPGVGFGRQTAYASLVDLKTGEVVWFNLLVSQQGDIRTQDGAAKMVERLLGRMKPGKAIKDAQ
ncbi:hypothetical protein [Sphingomicrobium nitratireducens]|uniref:hypothetical protein n=1 Tax=Sphingomicrobium nitratireducens TaxID=2964666 RepID=UPI00223FB3BB|nr:hypothetical protein [Sphingomicrobium nitratireducens]